MNRKLLGIPLGIIFFIFMLALLIDLPILLALKGMSFQLRSMDYQLQRVAQEVLPTPEPTPFPIEEPIETEAPEEKPSTRPVIEFERISTPSATVLPTQPL